MPETAAAVLNSGAGSNTRFSTRMESIAPDIADLLDRTHEWMRARPSDPARPQGRRSGGDPQIPVHDLGLGAQLVAGPAKDDVAGIEQIAAAGHRQGRRDVLLDHQDRAALLCQSLADLHQI